MFRRVWENARENQRQRNKHAKPTKKKKEDTCDACDPCSYCSNCGCLAVFSNLLMLGAATAAATRAPVVDRVGLAAIRGYRRWLSPHWPGQCRFTPTCGAYGLTAVERYGLAVGGRMAAERVRRCRPETPRGTHDPVR